MALSKIPRWLTGRDVSAFTFTPYTADAGGALTAGSALTLAGTFENLDFSIENEIVEKRAAGQRTPSRVIVGRSISFEISQLEALAPVAAETALNACLAAAANADWGLITVTRNIQTTGILETYAIFCTVMGGGENIDHENGSGKLSLKSTLVYDSGGADVTETYTNAS